MNKMRNRINLEGYFRCLNVLISVWLLVFSFYGFYKYTYVEPIWWMQILCGACVPYWLDDVICDVIKYIDTLKD